VIDRESNKMDRWIKEATCFRKEQDQLMNRDERSYQLSHVYDKLFAAVATSSGERKSTTSYRGRLQPLPKRQQYIQLYSPYMMVDKEKLKTEAK